MYEDVLEDPTELVASTETEEVTKPAKELPEDSDPFPFHGGPHEVDPMKRWKSRQPSQIEVTD